MRASPKARWSRWPTPRWREFEQAHGRFPGGELVVLGLGRLGGCALTHASDLDIIYLHTRRCRAALPTARKPLGPNDYFNRLASRVTAALSVPTAAGPLYDVDTRLRPEGAKGMLVGLARRLRALSARRGLDLGAYGAVPRPAGVRLGRGARAHRRDRSTRSCGMPRDPAKVAATRRRCAPRSSGTSRRQSALDVKLGPGGLVDLEFAVHVLQLTRHVGLDPRLEVALEALADDDLVDGKYCRCAKVADADAGHDAAGRAGRRQADAPTPGSWSPTPAARRAGMSCLPSMTRRGRASRELWNRIRQEA